MGKGCKHRNYIAQKIEPWHCIPGLCRLCTEQGTSSMEGWTKSAEREAQRVSESEKETSGHIYERTPIRSSVVFTSSSIANFVVVVIFIPFSLPLLPFCCPSLREPMHPLPQFTAVSVYYLIDKPHTISIFT